jgi:hypothetical protein
VRAGTTYFRSAHFWHGKKIYLSSLQDLGGARGLDPALKALGYFRVSLRDKHSGNRRKPWWHLVSVRSSVVRLSFGAERRKRWWHLISLGYGRLENLSYDWGRSERRMGLGAAAA